MMEEENLEDEYELEDVKSSSGDEAKIKMIKFVGLVIIIVIIIFCVLFIFSRFLTKKKYTYNDVETIMKEAAVSYFKDNPSSLPLEESDIVEIDATNLIADGRMKDFSEYLADGNSCTGSVQVEKYNTDYLYNPYLTCGDDYVTIELYKKVISENQVTSSGYGLYSVNGNYVFRGENVNNYVKIGEHLWRIVKINSNNNIVLISNDGVGYSRPWDNRYNKDKLYEAGINEYNNSRIREYLEKVYINPSEKDGEDILPSRYKSKLVSFNLCTGKRSINSEMIDNSEECGQLLNNQKFGLLTLSDYLYASIDPNCKSATTKSCKNYNYLVTKDDWWLVTANKDDSSSVYIVSRRGTVDLELASNYALVRPVIYLNSNALYKSGKGTLEKPFTIR